jgi:Fur family zinc uptake transcriptional regulator
MPHKQIVTPFQPAGHRHARCLREALSKAESNCADRGVRLTPLRRRVLELVWKSHEPVKAYDILQTLSAEKKGAAPPTVYRALDFLKGEGFVHRIQSLNAYVGCGEPGHNNTQFLICYQCGVVAELDDSEIGDLINRKASRLGFKTRHQTIEIQGLCTACNAG